MDSLHDLLEESMPVSPMPDLTRLSAELCIRGYTDHARGAVVAYARDLGTLEGCVFIDPGDRADLDAILEGSWAAVPQTSHAWDESPYRDSDRQPTWTLGRRARIAALAESFTAVLSPGDGEPFEVYDLGVASIGLGGVALVPPDLDVEPYEPTEEDWADYAEWCSSQPDWYPMPELEPFQS